ncbi:rhomboid family intramembrane serine protease [Flavobacterium agrisoli]|uniref:Rhomboid family intramembrane serine protease n=1 Tax=Flavobacterium agrisoli TaxID=2793066 RepID=A0A934PQU2_9FLAO|nr:rhomboid family intramembrane serine protease [Flavobacterium agrisoli]MBK0370963.1 rhomboid family intramembrane serine protease [Flavobacterium agrisoli]
MNDSQFRYSNSVLGFPFLFVLLLWIIYWVQIRFDYNFYDNGIFPRTFSGLQGIFLSAFIHADLSHLYHNTIPLFVLLAALRYFYPKQTAGVLFFGIVFSGIFTWVIARANYHIGASGLIYVLFSFIFFKGLQSHYYRLVALSLATIVVYGGMVWFMFPEGDQTISWEGHLSGFITGLFLSVFYKLPEYKKVYHYDWQRPDFKPENDAFLRQFDANGNFINPPLLEDAEEEDMSDNPYFTSNFDVKYILKRESNN